MLGRAAAPADAPKPPNALVTGAPMPEAAGGAPKVPKLAVGAAPKPVAA